MPSSRTGEPRTTTPKRTDELTPTSLSCWENRTESKSGFDKSLRKQGAGGHNWGSLRDELDLEREALEDNGQVEDADELNVDANADIRPSVDGATDIDKTNVAMTEDDVQKAREFREQGLNGEGASASGNRIHALLITSFVPLVALGDIARTSAGATSEHPAPALEVGRDAPVRLLAFMVVTVMITNTVI